jgi:hypothetical protein
MEAASVRRLLMGDEQDRLMELFNEARAKRSAEEREAYLAAAGGGDDALRRQIEVLLKAHAQAGDFLKPPSDVSPEGEHSGTVIGRYKLLQKIGEGGMGVVYMAEQQEPVRRRVALKLIKLAIDTKQVIARFESERQALALMGHPNIAKVLDKSSNSGGLCWRATRQGIAGSKGDETKPSPLLGKSKPPQKQIGRPLFPSLSMFQNSSRTFSKSSKFFFESHINNKALEKTTLAGTRFFEASHCHEPEKSTCSQSQRIRHHCGL